MPVVKPVFANALCVCAHSEQSSTVPFMLAYRLKAEARLELGTFRVWGKRDNHYTMETDGIMAFTSS